MNVHPNPVFYVLEQNKVQSNEEAMKAKNRLADTRSPYLRMHAENPVDWYPWGTEAFREAETQDKPVFLSIGYSTCHWCHVMERESFSDPEVAGKMNEAFISIKVDREERPDIDQLYMNVCQMLTGRGGWPLTVIMTPDKQPFFTATYIPKESRHGQKGMMDLIPQIRNLWEEERERVLNSAQEVTRILQRPPEKPTELRLNDKILRQAYNALTQRYDDVYGGFSQEPKFPSPHHLLFLLRYWRRTGEEQALSMVEKTLRQMRLGGLYDHVGYGFHRYSTDREWLLPHFEKMLYDQALLAMAYTEAYQVTNRELYRQTTREIFTYMLREMTSIDGAFFTARDADTEGKEGAYYLWTTDEIRDILDEEHAELFIDVYQLSEDGNFREESTGKQTGDNILYLEEPMSAIAERRGMKESELETELERARQALFARREQRESPLLDDKILTDWNGLMIAAFAKASRVFTDPPLAEDAEKAATFILDYMMDDEERLLHMYRKGQSDVLGNLPDYAFFIWGLLELYETIFKPHYLRTAMSLADDMMVRFWDTDCHGFFYTPDDGEDLIARQKEAYDGAYPSGNSVAMYVLIRLARLTGNPDYEQYALNTAKAFPRLMKDQPDAFTMMLCGLDFAIEPAYEIVIAGQEGTSSVRAMIRALWTTYLPNAVTVFRSERAEDEITQLAEYTVNQTPIDNKATAYVCQNFTCKQPTTDVDQMLEYLGEI